ncbi:hypothetical protein [Curtobacterium sp. MCJR17_020]|uniref:preATP grasp domain-containing protein n=1 Tax=Curtobacterium sp. MCJR17_020 TaxID=2175619 RepID=UPI000DA966C0|nr:hypothetical protein [Curtobacterium sp. MCJR17_020]WIE74159.1 hypothetical protein DEJ14_018810 [Curtobacterium sp. MCJR17_020]
MGAIIIGNQLVEETATGHDELPVEYRRYLGMVSHRLLWTARPGDVVVLPNRPHPAFVEHVWHTLGVEDNAAPQILVPPVGARDDLLLYEDRLLDEDFCAELGGIVDPSKTDVRAFFHDDVVAELCARLGVRGTPSRSFLEQSGTALVNSKSTFRAIASGLGLSVPAGIVALTASAAEAYIWSHLAEGRSVIVKQDGHGGGYGNEIIRSPGGPSGFGASRTITIEDRQGLDAELLGAWDRWSGGGRPVVVEEYSADSVPLYAEFSITESGPELVGHGEMRVGTSDDGPTNRGLVIPAIRATGSGRYQAFLDEAHRLVGALGAMGYRGSVSVDSILLPDGRILLNEFNGRTSGSTHVHILCRALLGEDALLDRVTLVRSNRALTNIPDALRRIRDAGLWFNRTGRSGVLLGGDDGQLIIIGSTLEETERIESHLEALLAPA